MVDAALFIGLAIIGVTQLIKEVINSHNPGVDNPINGAITIAVATALGIVVAVVDTSIGLTNITIAQGIVIALSAVGFHTAATR